MDSVPPIRVTVRNAADIRADAAFVLYWMIAFRRTRWNFALQRAVDWSLRLRKPLLVFEPLRASYRWASARLHRVIIDGMADNAARLEGLARCGVGYFPYVEPAPGAGRGLLAALAGHACVVVTDEFPCFFLPRMVTRAAAGLAVRLEQVDSNGLLPLRAASRAFPTAHAFRRFLQAELPAHLACRPLADPLAGLALPPLAALPEAILRRWPPAPPALLAGDGPALASLPIDHTVAPVARRGGERAAHVCLREFLDHRLARYAEEANDPGADARSSLSPYLHFGHISVHEAFFELMDREGWTPERFGARPSGSRQGWWGASPAAEAWLDQLVTWRELGFNTAAHLEDYDRYGSLPAWARATLEAHAGDRRSHVYSVADLAAARTHDPLWNAAQTQLLREGVIHNYLRMLWGKKILEWTPSPQDALDVMIELNNRYAVDGRDPNSYSGIFWVLGRYDRPWGPERPVFGTVRYMSSRNTQRKFRLEEYLRKYSAPEGAGTAGHVSGEPAALRTTSAAPRRTDAAGAHAGRHRGAHARARAGIARASGRRRR
jgi:deoxyribodipyrimidine photo-lyase